MLEVYASFSGLARPHHRQDHRAPFSLSAICLHQTVGAQVFSHISSSRALETLSSSSSRVSSGGLSCLDLAIMPKGYRREVMASAR
jgi:hypothetical protein